MDGGSGNYVSRIGHRNGPSKMVVSFVRAELLSSQPFGGKLISKSRGPLVRKEKSGKKHRSSNKTQALDENVLVEILLILSQRSVDDVAEVRLETDVKKSGHSQDLVHERIADRGIESGSDEEVLNRLKKLHREEEEDSGSQASVRRLTPNPP